MPKRSTRSKFYPVDIRELWLPQGDAQNVVPFNLLAHESSHGVVEFLYTSTATLSTTISTPWYPGKDYSIVSARLQVAGAPVSTACVWDVLIDGDSIFRDTAERPKVPAGSLSGPKRAPSRQGMPSGCKLQFQGVTLSSATGPAVVTLELVSA